MDFLFELPRSNKELLDDANCSNYFVKQVFDVDEIPALLRVAHKALQSNDAFYIFDHFDTFFSVIEHVSQLKINSLVRSVDILYRTAENLGQVLDTYLKQKNLDRQNDFLNLIKMVMYLVVSTVRAVDKFIEQNFNQTSGRKNKKTMDENTSNVETYEAKRYDILIQVCNIMQLPIEKLWNMSIIDENFVSLLCELAYRSLTHPSTKEKRVNDAIFQILGIAIKQYSHGIAFPVQIVEIMDREESAVVPIARGVRYLNDEFGITSVMGNLLKELIDKVNTNPAAQITSKNLSLFITEIGEISSDLSLQCLQMAHDLLNLEPYGVRNSLFGMTHAIILNHLSGEDLNEDLKTLRDECLEDLWNHMNDVNSYVRSKVLHIWNDLKNRNAVPLAWILQVVTRAVERLEDRTATVRRNATILLRSFLESNPFSSKLQLDTLEQSLNEQTEKMQVIRAKAREQYRTQTEKQTDYQTRCVPDLNRILTAILGNEQQTDSLIAHAATINSTEVNERVQKIRQYLNDGKFDEVAVYVIQLDALSGNQNVWKSMRTNEQVLYFLALLQTYLFDDYESEIEKQRNIVEFLEEALAFSKAMSQAVPRLEEMLMSTTESDVLEAIEFFKTGYLFHIKRTDVGMRLMLRLLYINTGQEKNEKAEAVINAYHNVLFRTDATGRAHDLQVVNNLYKFLQNILMSEYTAFELMIKHWVLSDEINANIINILFERFTMKLSDTSTDFARCCLELLILISNTKPAVAQNNMNVIIDILNGRRISEDPRIFSGCLKLLMVSIQPTDGKGIKTNKTVGYYKRFEDQDVIDGIIHTFKRFFFFQKLADFESIATQSIDFLYKMCNAPDLLSQTIIHDLCNKLGEISQKQAEKMMIVDDNGEDGADPSPATKMYIPKYLLPRIIFIFGYVASKELVYLDNDVYLNIKYREELHSKDKKSNHAFNSDGSINETVDGLTTPNTSAADAQEQVYLGASAEDTLADMITNICDNQLIGSADGLFNHMVPILKEILSHPAKYSDQYAQRSAILTLMRFMVVSSTFCASEIAFVMNILKKTKSASMKCNIVIGLSDLTSRFANTIEPWIPNFYTMLLETDKTIRLTTMKMLTYMILQGIIRATGQVSDMAACIFDDCPEIQDAAKEFFRQLVASKEMEYYKVLPDIVSCLSSNELPIAEHKFQTIMKYLLELIQKDRQVESLVEKLCVRFRNTNTERQWRDIAFCLSLLNHSEKTMKKLLDHLPNYKEKIQHDEIYDCFKTIISNANKQITKPELRNLAKELDGKLQKLLQHGADANVSMDGSVLGSGNTPRKQDQKTPKDKKKRKDGKKTKPKKNLRRSLSSGEDDDFDDVIPVRRGRNRK